LKAYDELKVNALTLERVLRDVYQVELPHNRIHIILKEAGRALPQRSKQRRRKWVRYEREGGVGGSGGTTSTRPSFKGYHAKKKRLFFQ
jgi:hypothetical protein